MAIDLRSQLPQQRLLLWIWGQVYRLNVSQAKLELGAKVLGGFTWRWVKFFWHFCIICSIVANGNARDTMGGSSGFKFTQAAYNSYDYNNNFSSSSSSAVWSPSQGGKLVSATPTNVPTTRATTTRQTRPTPPAPVKVIKQQVERPKKSKKYKKEPKQKLKKNGKCCRLTKAQKEAKRLKKLQGRVNRQIKIHTKE